MCKGNWLLSYRCKGCGVGIYNATKEYSVCDACGHKYELINPIRRKRGRFKKNES